MFGITSCIKEIFKKINGLIVIEAQIYQMHICANDYFVERIYYIYTIHMYSLSIALNCMHI
jgi:hypothetical protein